MNGKDILLYTLCAAGTLYALWIIINIAWLGILSLKYPFTNGKKENKLNLCEYGVIVDRYYTALI